MTNTEGLCRHEKILRNCYDCYYERNAGEEKDPLDTINEKLSELQIRIAKIEQYKLLQADQNKNLLERNHEIIKQQIECQKQVNNLDEHRKKQIDENRAVFKHLNQLDEYIEETKQDIIDLNVHFDNLFRNDMRQTERLDKHEEAIPKLDKWMNALEIDFAKANERIINLEKTNQAAIDANPIKDIYERIEKLENLSDFKKLEACILEGAQTHLSILKMERKFKEIEELQRVDQSGITHLTEWVQKIDDRLESFICSSSDPHVCTKPVRCTVIGGGGWGSTNKTTGLTFEEAFAYYRAGKKIKRKHWDDSLNKDAFLEIASILKNDWEVID